MEATQGAGLVKPHEYQEHDLHTSDGRKSHLFFYSRVALRSLIMIPWLSTPPSVCVPDLSSLFPLLFFFFNFLLSAQKSDLDIEVEENAGDEQYMSILSEHIPRLIEQIQPDLIFYQVMCRARQHLTYFIAKKRVHASVVISRYTD